MDEDQAQDAPGGVAGSTARAMRVLTLTQPWATLIARGLKRIETRGWTTGYRGSLAIRAAAGYPSAAQRRVAAELCREAMPGQPLDALPHGAVVALCWLEDVVPVEALGTVAPAEARYGDYSPGRFGWMLRELIALREPVPCGGGLGLRHAPPELIDAVRRATAG